jgi:drug/metabolite transporter (DMT)-like permease|tara:strand:- start:657 stop:1493 length:837 start_codon:yes stop_codon:yes gene_type:complete
MILAVFLFPLKDAFAKMTGGYYSAILVVWAQFVFTGGIYLLVIVIRHGPGVLRPAAPLMQILRAAFAVAGMGAFYWAITLIPLAEATAMQFIAPLVVTALSPLFLGEQLGWRRWLSVVAGFVGVLIVLRPEFGGERFGYGVALLSGLFLGLCFIMNRKLAHVASPIKSVAYSACLGAIMITPLVPSVWIMPRAEDLPLILGFLGVSLLGQTCLFTAFHYGQASVVAPFHFVQIIGATLFGYLFFSEFPDTTRFAGIAVIILAGVYIAMREAKKSRATA